LIQEWEKERVSLHSFGLVWFHRLNVGMRGNHLGKYVDLGVYAHLTYSTLHRFRGKDGLYEVEAKITNPSYLGRTIPERSSYGLQLAFGWNKVALKGQYRMSDQLNDIRWGDLPRLFVGIELSF
jgi:hypothetical protein